MITFEEALKIALSNCFETGTMKIPIEKAIGYILAEDIIADSDMPPFDKSAVDGFACRMEDLSKVLKVIETIPAGKNPENKIVSGTCAKIMTGAPVPDGADCVVMVEQSEESSDTEVRFSLNKTSANICYQGEDVKAGDLLISKGSLINAGQIAVMASAGYGEPLVASLPKVAILSTGDELVEPSEKPSASQIRNSNAYQLLAQCSRMGIKAEYRGIIPDREEETFKQLEAALESADVVLLTGGVSMGDYDHVPAMMEKAGLEVLFRKIAIQPGKPTVMAKGKGKLCFGLPGNPVSSYVLFELLVKPVLYQMMAHNYQPAIVKARLAVDYKRKRGERMNAVPVFFNENRDVILSDYHGSAHIHAMIGSVGLLLVPLGIMQIEKGSIIDVRLI